VSTFQVYALAGFGAVSAIVVVAVLLWFVFKAAVGVAVDLKEIQGRLTWLELREVRRQERDRQALEDESKRRKGDKK